ncbi:MAG: hypothetical protein C0405_11235, partial [Desulfovibrio sp.]|nr:hypothetical protein [Desulfovibrio sp.]
SAGDGHAAAASHPDGRIQTFGLGSCSSLTMPGGHPAYALALSRDGSVLAAWAQGVQQLVSFDLRTPGCPATAAKSSLQGRISMTLSSTGAFLAAQDSAGNVWIGQGGWASNSTEGTGGRLRLVATLPGAPAAIGFSEGEGMLLVLDAQGRGGSWNPRTGKALRQLEVPGGPFLRGEFSGLEARLWSTAGHMVRWDLLHNTAAGSEAAPHSPETAPAGAWLELRGTELYHVRQERTWQSKPVYVPHLPQLTFSKKAACLRLADVDAVVRYFDARTGLPQPQCLAGDWALVAIHPDGTAQIPGLRLRIFETHARTDANAASGSKVNSRAISETQAHLWADHQPELSIRIKTAPQPTTTMLQKALQPVGSSETETLVLTLRQSLAAEAPATPLRVK